MNAKISVFFICVEAIIYLLYNLHDCIFKIVLSALGKSSKVIIIFPKRFILDL